MSQVTRNIVAAIVAVVVLGLLALGFDAWGKKASPDLNQQYRHSTQFMYKGMSATNKVPVTTQEPIAYDGQDNKNVLELLKANHQVQSVDSSYGTYVQAIDGINSTENSVWLYYINNEPGLEAADKAVTKTGDKVEWRYESF